MKEWLYRQYKTSIIGPALVMVEDAEFINKFVKPSVYYAVTDERDYGVTAFTAFGATNVTVAIGHDDEWMLRVTEGVSGNRELENTGDCEDWVRLGYFVDNGNIILIENGLPRFRHESVQAHELSHQWQRECLDMAKIKAQPIPFTKNNDFGVPIDLSDFRVEGHASWVEWKYLIKHGHRKEANELKRMLMNRNDEYGVGFRWFSKLMKIGGKDIYAPDHVNAGMRFRLLKCQLMKNPFAMMELLYGDEATDETTP